MLLPEPTHLYFWSCRGINGAPPDRLGFHLSGEPEQGPPGKDCPSHRATAGEMATAGYSYWALSGGPSDEFPTGVLIHILHEGELPGDRDRGRINAAAQQIVSLALEQWGEEEDPP